MPTSASTTRPTPWHRSSSGASASTSPEVEGAEPPRATSTRGPLADLRVVDASTVLAGPSCARYLADFGADVVKVERPDGGDTLRSLGWRDPRDDVTLWWKYEGRNKRTV